MAKASEVKRKGMLRIMEIIKIKLKNLNEATASFNEEILNNELDNYLTSSCKHISSKERISLLIKDFTNKEDQIDLINLIHNHYLHKVKYLNKIDKYDDYFRFLLLLLGIILIIISEIFSALLSELFLIAGWVVIWEVVYDILFTGIKRKQKLKIAQKLSTCEISFINEN